MNREIWEILPFKSKYMYGNVYHKGCFLHIIGNVSLMCKSNSVNFWAADSQLENSSASGDNLPFINEDQAFYRKENIGNAIIVDNMFNFTIKTPNSYYKHLGSVYIPPILQLALNDNPESLFNIKLSDGIPYRYLSHPANKSYASDTDKLYCPSGPYFYNNISNLPIRSQYDILCSSQYPDKNIMPPNFWGDKPSL